jgi:excisionase family DNA binding protein
VKKVAEILDFSGEKVRQLCRDGEIEYTGDGRGYRIYLDSVAAYQERQTRRRAS